MTPVTKFGVFLIHLSTSRDVIGICNLTPDVSMFFERNCDFSCAPAGFSLLQARFASKSSDANRFFDYEPVHAFIEEFPDSVFPVCTQQIVSVVQPPIDVVTEYLSSISNEALVPSDNYVHFHVQ